MTLRIEKIDLARDFPEIEKLLLDQEWPFLRGDLEVSHRQPKAVGYIALQDKACAGFFLTHHFGDIGYLDMMIVGRAFQKSGVARPLFLETMAALEKNGLRAFVVHTTQDSAPMIRFLEFSPGQSFTLLRLESGASCQFVPPVLEDEEVQRLSSADLPEILALDAKIFGLPRPSWIGELMAQSEVKFYGLRRKQKLVASLCLRPRRDHALCLDMANAERFEDLEKLLAHLMPSLEGFRLECFARTHSDLHRYLETQGFKVPEFFQAIGPLTEWRKGATGEVGLSANVQCLSWF